MTCTDEFSLTILSGLLDSSRLSEKDNPDCAESQQYSHHDVGLPPVILEEPAKEASGQQPG
jgi:hypothetical protein